MKSIFICLLTFMIVNNVFAESPRPTHNETRDVSKSKEWALLALTASNEDIIPFYIKKVSILETQDGRYTAWFLNDLGVRKVSKTKEVIVQTLWRIEFDCQKKQYRQLEEVNRNLQFPYSNGLFGGFDSSKPSDEKWKTIRPETLMEKALKYLCNGEEEVTVIR